MDLYMEENQPLLADTIEEFRAQFPNHPHPDHYPIQFGYLVKLFLYDRKRKAKMAEDGNLVVVPPNP